MFECCWKEGCSDVNLLWEGAFHEGGAKLPSNQTASEQGWTFQDYLIWYFKKFIFTIVTNITKDENSVIHPVVKENGLDYCPAG